MTLPVRFDMTGPYEVDQDDIVFARPSGTDLLARVYRPRGEAAAPLGAVVYVHGGAWARLDRTADPILCGALAAAGLVVVALDFRQAPDHRYPAAGADVAAGVRYTRAHAARLGVDAARIGLLGSSSGGLLSLLHGVKPAAPEHAGTPIVRPDGGLDAGAGDAAVAFVVALYPVADPLARYRYARSREHEPPPPSGFDARRLIASHRAFFTDEAAMAAVSVTRIVQAGEATARPPVWIAQPDQDDNVPAAITEAFVHAYRQAGGHVELEHFPDARHGFVQQAGPDTDKCIAQVKDFIGRQCFQRGPSA
ncbi:MAG TPA: alpha/beta hydrolase [Methylomirabilota bacterium]|jgi:acetyl esterase|nr:alpha/beta hydrolase [Methylomirabilota bacterium]